MSAPKLSSRKARQAHLRQQQFLLETSLLTNSSPSSDDESSSLITLNITAPMAQPRLFIASIGNPAPYLSTLHSAGHTVLHTLASILPSSPFQKSRSYANGLLSTAPGTPYTFWQSPSLMNVSGSALAIAWKQFLRDNGNEGRLVVVHDELELGLGQVNIKSGKNSPRGHNGLKSIKERMANVDYTRIGIGIGRPESREPNAVAAYVLRKMTPGEKLKIEGSAGRVLEELARLAG